MGLSFGFRQNASCKSRFACRMHQLCAAVSHRAVSIACPSPTYRHLQEVLRKQPATTNSLIPRVPTVLLHTSRIMWSDVHFCAQTRSRIPLLRLSPLSTVPSLLDPVCTYVSMRTLLGFSFCMRRSHKATSVQ